MTETKRDATLLPLSTKHASLLPTGAQGGQNGSLMFESPVGMSEGAGHAYTQGSAAAATFASGDSKKTDDAGGRNRGMSNAGNAGWRPPGTRAEDTWRAGDIQTAAAR